MTAVTYLRKYKTHVNVNTPLLRRLVIRRLLLAIVNLYAEFHLPIASPVRQREEGRPKIYKETGKTEICVILLGRIAVLRTLMRPIVTDRVVWSVGRSLCLSVTLVSLQKG